MNLDQITEATELEHAAAIRRAALEAAAQLDEHSPAPGFCRCCGVEIDADRLAALPHAARCIQCARLEDSAPVRRRLTREEADNAATAAEHRRAVIREEMRTTSAAAQERALAAEIARFPF